MNTLPRCLGWFLSGLLLWPGGARAQAGLSADVLQQYGGIYAVQCDNPKSPRLRVERQALHVEQGNRRLSARSGLMAMHAYFGQSAPPGFLVALEAQVQPQLPLTFLVFQDAQGQYVTLDGHPKVLTTLGALSRQRYQSCNAAANLRGASEARQEQQARAAAQTPMAASQASSPSDLVRDPQFRAAWLALLGPLSREAWLARMDGPAPDLKRERLAGQIWLLAAFCKPHDCGDNNAVVVYDEASGNVHALVHRSGVTRLVGVPPGHLGPELQRVWRREWRQGR
jgi:hypothetical protein